MKKLLLLTFTLFLSFSIISCGKDKNDNFEVSKCDTTYNFKNSTNTSGLSNRQSDHSLNVKSVTKKIEKDRKGDDQYILNIETNSTPEQLNISTTGIYVYDKDKKHIDCSLFDMDKGLYTTSSFNYGQDINYHLGFSGKKEYNEAKYVELSFGTQKDKPDHFFFEIK